MWVIWWENDMEKDAGERGGRVGRTTWSDPQVPGTGPDVGAWRAVCVGCVLYAFPELDLRA